MLKHLFVVISVSLLAVACGGGAEEAKTPADAPKEGAAAEAPKEGAPAADAPKEGAPAADAKPAGEAAPK